MNHRFPTGAHDDRLVSLVHPAGWKNPVPEGRYNLVVLGGGTAGLVAAMGAAGLGARVALVERHLLGGDCLNTGCVPSKALIATATEAHRAATLMAGAGEGIGIPSFGIDFPAVMDRMRAIRASIAPHDSATRLRDAGVDVYFGSGSFVGVDSLEVDGGTEHGGSRILRFARAVIATGARPAVPSIPGLQEVGFLTSETVFNLTERPERLAVIGAGPIGCELAQAFCRLGSDVTVVALDPQVLPREDPEAAELVAAQLQADGVDLRLGSTVESVGREADGLRLDLSADSEGGASSVVVDRILVAVGRQANVEGIGLETAGVAHDRNGITVDDFLRTANSRIYAAGDVCSLWKFTHAADAMARIVIQNALFFGRKRVSDLSMSWCTYTQPEVAHAGLTENDALESKLEVDVRTVSLDSMDRARTDGINKGFVRMLTARSSGKLLGATVVAPHAGDLIAPAVVAMSRGASATDLSGIILPYPTTGEVWKRLGDAANRDRLTPRVRKVLGRLLAWRR